MSALTEARREVKAALAHLPEQVSVAAGPGEYAGEHQLLVRVVVGAPCEESEERLDALLDRDGEGSVLRALAPAGYGVAKHSGYQLYEVAPGQRLLGATWTVNTVF